MNKLLLLALLALTITSCGSSRKVSSSKEIITSRTEKIPKRKAGKVVAHAKQFEGTRYKFGGTTKKGMDCSGLVYVAFQKENIVMPRVSRDMATQGKRIRLNETDEGDLVFFQTNKNRRVINHVGLVVENRKGDIMFIHSTSSRGVIISSLSEKYWKDAFVEVRRII